MLGKVYGYTDRYTELKEVLLSNTFLNVVPSLRYGKNQKNNLDIQLVIDAMEVAYANPLINGFCIVSGDSDYTPLVEQASRAWASTCWASRARRWPATFSSKPAMSLFSWESVATSPVKQQPTRDADVREDIKELAELVPTILGDQAEERMYASELKGDSAGGCARISTSGIMAVGVLAS